MDLSNTIQIGAPIFGTLLAAVVTFLAVVWRVRIETANVVKQATQALRDKAEMAEAVERVDFRAAQRVEMQELRAKVAKCETDKAEMIVKLAKTEAQVLILEARMAAFESARRETQQK